jgi:hypothetical protein
VGGRAEDLLANLRLTPTTTPIIEMAEISEMKACFRRAVR